MPEGMTMTMSDTERLYQEKMQRLREELGQTERSLRDSTDQRDKAVHEVTTLQQEKSALIEELATAKQEKQRILDSLAESRRNVEASLDKREAQANLILDQASHAEAAMKDHERAIQQARSQVAGIKQTLLAEAQAILQTVTDLVQKTQDALSAIPD